MTRGLTLLALLAGLALSALPASSQTVTERAIHPDGWLSHAALKWGFVGAFSGSQALSGIVEGYSFGGRSIAGPDTYHAFRTARDIGWLSTGYLGYATLDNPGLSRMTKARRVLGAAMLGRNAFEWGYKAHRYGNPFDYTEAHNLHSLVYFGIRKGAVVDCYIGTGPVSGPLVDMAFLAAGLLLLGD